MKCRTDIVHTITATAANVHDITEARKLIREDDEVVYGDSGYTGIEKREEIRNDKHLSSIEYRINRRPKRLPKVSDNAVDWKDILITESPQYAARSSMRSNILKTHSISER